jgi:small subunit ribosomal protein S20
MATPAAPHHNGTLMANTKSAKKATRKIARRTEVNKARRSRMRNYLRLVEDAIAGGDPAKAQSALKAAEPELMRAAQRGVIHKRTASRKVSRLTHQIGKLGK